MIPSSPHAIKPMRYYEVLCTKKGTIFITSTYGLIVSDGYISFNPSYLTIDDDSKSISRSYKAEDSIKSFCEGAENSVFFCYSR
jgi:hypothetical protein